MRFENLLRLERLRCHLSQEALAEALGVSPRSIRRWEQDGAIPQASVRLKICRFFGLSYEELFEDQEAQTPFTQVWSVPYPRNPFFTGREKILSYLHEQLNQEHAMALTQSLAISGLGGIGKTQIALEYTYQYRQDYRFVFWTSAATQENIQADLISIAALLHLPEQNSQDQKKVIAAVKQWFATHQGWLWVLDNADDMTIVQHILPTERPGHLLLTTRAQALGALAQPIEVETMGMTEASLLLLRRARLIAPDIGLDGVSENRLAAAEALAIALDFLPLALDQAGAYIEEVGCGLSNYLDLYRTHRKALLARRGTQTTHYPDSVATTWSLSFQKIEQVFPAAAELLCLCAFLAPDRIPEELLTMGAHHWPPLLQQAAEDSLALQRMLEELRKFSLVKRQADDQLFSIHRLVQAVQIEQMAPETQQRWAERIVRAVNTSFPQDPQKDVAQWPQCMRYLEQAQVCDLLIQLHHFRFAEAADLLNRTGIYLRVHAFYPLAESLFQRSLIIYQQTLGYLHPHTATALNDLAILHWLQGQYTQAEPFYKQALAISEQILEPSHPNIAASLNDLALLYEAQGKYEQAEQLYQRALAIREEIFGELHTETATTLNNLALLYKQQGKYEQAEQLYQRALTIWEQLFGELHPHTANSLNNLARLYQQLGKYEQAEQLFQRALAISEQLFGELHLHTSTNLNNLALLYQQQGKYEQAEQLLQRALTIRQQILEPYHPHIAQSLNNLAKLYRLQGKYEQAEPLHQQALVICEQQLGPQHLHTTHPLLGLALLYRDQGKNEQAEFLFQRVLLIRKQTLEPTHPDIALALHEFAILRQAQGYNDEACSLYKQALAARTLTLGTTHPDTISTSEHLAGLLHHLDRIEKVLLNQVL